jgi:hypothetical protein
VRKPKEENKNVNIKKTSAALHITQCSTNTGCLDERYPK